jgi:hypothetical protein
MRRSPLSVYIMGSTHVPIPKVLWTQSQDYDPEPKSFVLGAGEAVIVPWPKRLGILLVDDTGVVFPVDGVPPALDEFKESLDDSFWLGVVGLEGLLYVANPKSGDGCVAGFGSV